MANKEKPQWEIWPSPAYTIYCLVDPTDLLIRYVGCTLGGFRKVRARVSDHIHAGYGDVHWWCVDLVNNGYRPIPAVVEIGYERFAAPEAEAFWISEFRMAGHPLMNIHKTSRYMSRLCAKPMVEKPPGPMRKKSKELHGKTDAVIETLRVQRGDLQL